MTTVIKGKVVRSDLSVWDGVESTVSRRDSTGGTITSLPINDFVDVLQAYGNGTNYTLEAISRCVNHIGSRSRTLIFSPGTWTIDDDLTIGSNFTCRIAAGAVFSVSSGKTLTFNGPVIRDSNTWTSGSGTVTESGTRAFTGTNTFAGTETHTATETHSGTITHSGTDTFSGTQDFTGTVKNLLRGICEGRLTLTTGSPVTDSDVTAATTIYFAPYKGSRISVYDGSDWVLFGFTELSIAVPSTTSQMYDVFVYDNSGTLTLELTAWTNDTTRATALTTQDGVYVKTGATTRRYLGSFRTTGVSGETEDSIAKRYVWNYYHRTERPMRVVEATNTWTYTTATFRQANAAAANQLDYVQGVSEDPVTAEVIAIGENSSVTNIVAGIGVDSTSTNSAQIFAPGLVYVVNTRQIVSAKYRGFPGVGRHYLAWLEYSAATGTTTWTGDAGGVLVQAGIHGSILG